MLERSDISEMISLLRLLEKVPDQRSFFELMFRGFEKILNISSGVFIPYDRVQNTFRIEGHFVFNHDSSVYLDYVGYYHLKDPFVYTNWIHQKGSPVALLDDLAPASTIYRSEYVVDFLSKIPAKYLLGMRFIDQGDLMGTVGLHRDERLGNFSNRDREIAEVLAQPLSEIFHRREFLAGVDAFSNPDIGLLIADSKGTVLYSNSLAQCALEDSSPSSLVSLAKGTAPVYIRSRRCVFRVRNFPLTSNSTLFLENRIAGKAAGGPRNGVRVLLFEPVASPPSVKKRLETSGLTPRQRTVVEKVFQGLTNREIAEEFDIAEQTVKDHLHDIFEKLRIRNRIELTTYFMSRSDSEREKSNLL